MKAEELYMEIMNDSKTFFAIKDCVIKPIKKALDKPANTYGLLSSRFEEDNGKYNCWNIPTNKLTFLAYSLRELLPPLKPAGLIKAYFEKVIITQEREKYIDWEIIHEVARDICDYFAKEIELGNY